MSKVLKPVAAIAAVVGMIPGPWQLPARAIAVAASLGATLLAPKAKAPTEARNRLFASLDPLASRKLVFGDTAMATQISFKGVAS